MASIQSIINQIETVANSHSYIQAFYQGDMDDFAVRTNNVYPCFCITTDSSPSPVNGIVRFSFQIHIIDRVNDDMSNVEQIKNSCNTALVDIITLLNSSESVTFTLETSDLTTFKQNLTDVGNSDLIAGSFCTFNITSLEPVSVCSIPVKANLSTSTSDGATYFNGVNVDGSWRIKELDDNLLIQRYENGAYFSKFTIYPEDFGVETLQYNLDTTTYIYLSGGSMYLADQYGNYSLAELAGGSPILDAYWTSGQTVSYLESNYYDKVAVDSLISSISGITGSTFNPSSLESSISQEASIRTSVDASLFTLISEISGQTGSTFNPASLESSISTEASIRLSVDNTLSTNISSEASIRSASDTSLSTSIVGEASNRTSVDASLYTNISTEISNRTSSDSVLSTSISTEASLRTTADTSLSTALVYEISTRGSINNTLSTNISSEASIRTAVGTSLSTSIVGEASTRLSVDNSLFTLISQISGQTGSTFDPSSLESSISSEASIRSAADTSLSTSLSNEISTRGVADTSLSTAILNESSTRVSDIILLNNSKSDTGHTHSNYALSTGLSSEISNRISGDASLYSALSGGTGSDTTGITSLSTALSSEASTRGSVDSVLSASIFNKLDKSSTGSTSYNYLYYDDNFFRIDSIYNTTKYSKFQISYNNFNIEIRTPTTQTPYSKVNFGMGSGVVPSITNYGDNGYNGIAVFQDRTRFTNICKYDTDLSASIDDLSLIHKLYADNRYAQISGLTSVSTALSSEVSTRGSYDTVLSTAISSEASTRGAADTSLSTAVSARVSVDVSLSTAISSEASTRTAADTSLSTAISSEASTRTAADTSLSTAITSEVSTRTSQATSLSTIISTEISTRGSADTSLSTAISTRVSVDGSLSTSISTETSNRISADTSLYNALSGSTGGSSTLSGLTDVNFQTALESGDILTFDGDYWSNSEAIDVSTNATEGQILILSGGTISGITNDFAKLSGLTSLSTSLSSEISTRGSADTSLSTAIIQSQAYSATTYNIITGTTISATGTTTINFTTTDLYSVYISGTTSGYTFAFSNPIVGKTITLNISSTGTTASPAFSSECVVFGNYSLVAGKTNAISVLCISTTATKKYWVTIATSAS